MNKLTIPVAEIKTGDVFADPVTGAVFWTAVEDAVTAEGGVSVLVRLSDGGRGPRIWDAVPVVTLDVLRPA